MVQETGVQSQVESKTQKMVFDAALLSTQHYKVRIKGKVKQSREGVAPSLYLGVAAIEKIAFGSPSTKVVNFTLLTYMVLSTERLIHNQLLIPSSFFDTNNISASSTIKNSNWMTIYLLSHKPHKKDEQDMLKK